MEHQLAENVSQLIAKLALRMRHALAPATTTWKDTLPRVAALLDMNMLGDVLAVVSADTLKRLTAVMRLLPYKAAMPIS